MTKTGSVLPVRLPFFTASTDQLIGSVPAAANPTVANWYCANALELTVCGEELGIRNSGWRANPFLLTVEADPSCDPAGTAEYLLRSGFYTAFCGLADGGCPSAGLICGMRGDTLTAVCAAPDGRVRTVRLTADRFVQGMPRVLRGIRVRSVQAEFDASAATGALMRYLNAPDRAEAVRLYPDWERIAGSRSLRMLTEQRRAVLGALLRLEPDGDAGERYRREVLLPTVLGIGRLADTWQAEERILAGCAVRAERRNLRSRF